MTTTLCEYDRDTLEWALDACEEPTDRWLTIVAPFGDDNEVGRCAIAVVDPAKLAELTAEEFRRRGVDVGGAPPAPLRAYNVFHGADCVGLVDWSRSKKPDYNSAAYSGAMKLWSMIQARAALLRLMQLPEGTPVADVLKALEVVT